MVHFPHKISTTPIVTTKIGAHAGALKRAFQRLRRAAHFSHDLISVSHTQSTKYTTGLNAQ